MLEDIRIQNFRCFENFKAEGFERINLIGGKNNSGKTFLLEAIGCLSNKFSVQELFSMRTKNTNSVVFKSHKSNILFRINYLVRKAF